MEEESLDMRRLTLHAPWQSKRRCACGLAFVSSGEKQCIYCTIRETKRVYRLLGIREHWQEAES